MPTEINFSFPGFSATLNVDVKTEGRLFIATCQIDSVMFISRQPTFWACIDEIRCLLLDSKIPVND